MVTIGTTAWSVPSIQSTTRYRESQVSLAIVVDQTFTSGVVGLHTCAHLFIDHRCVTFFFFVCEIFPVGLDHEIVLTVKFPDLGYWNYIR